jgi:hypothetical protein
MCDKAHFEELEKRVDLLEMATNIHLAKSEEQIKTLFNAVQKLFWITCIFGGVLLFTVVYGAIGERGFHAVTHATQEVAKLSK